MFQKKSNFVEENLHVHPIFSQRFCPLSSFRRGVIMIKGSLKVIFVLKSNYLSSHLKKRKISCQQFMSALLFCELLNTPWFILFQILAPILPVMRKNGIILKLFFVYFSYSCDQNIEGFQLLHLQGPQLQSLNSHYFKGNNLIFYFQNSSTRLELRKKVFCEKKKKQIIMFYVVQEA